jgi:hypothetical protein
MTSDEFDEFDMTVEEFDRQWAEGEPVEIVVPIGWRCEHVSITTGGGRIGKPMTTFCCCDLKPIFVGNVA